MRILVYGDSNSWGYVPGGNGARFGPDQRWPCLMAAALGAELIEDCIPGRTIATDDPDLQRPEDAHVFNGLTHFPVAFRAAIPVDLVLIMLGTNDFKARFAPTPEKLAGNLAQYVQALRTYGGRNGWNDPEPPAIGVIVPPVLTDHVNAPDWERVAEWRGAQEVSRRLLSACEAQLDVPVLAAGACETGAPDDPIHLTAAGHAMLARRVTDWVAERF